MRALYRVVVTRLHRWADQMARRVEKETAVARRGSGSKRKRTPSAAGAPAGTGGTAGTGDGGSGHAMRTRGATVRPSKHVTARGNLRLCRGRARRGLGTTLWPIVVPALNPDSTTTASSVRNARA